MVNQSNYKEYRHCVPDLEDKLLQKLYKTLDEIMAKGEDRTIDDLFVLCSDQNHKYSTELELIYESIRNANISEDSINALLTSIRQRAWATELGNAAFSFSEGRGSIEDINGVWEKLPSVQDDSVDGIQFVTDDLEVLYEHTVKSPGLRWRLSTLNKSIGSLRKGDFGIVFARPETGKTTFLASEVTFFASQAPTPGLWFNNEQEGSQVGIRCYQAALGETLTELLYDREKNRNRYFEETKRNLKIYDSASIHRKDVEKMCEIYKPSFIVFDQLDKIKGFDSDARDDIRLGSIYIWARELAKEYCPVIGVCQAGASGEGKKYLAMDDMANSKTAKAAEADWILGIGKTHTEGLEFIRHFNIIKNKLLGDEDTDPSLRHSKHDVIIDVEIGRYRDI